ncbi:MAG: hypothetical protein FJ088_12190 [Deltaproteobacteria bacterium]|nr:hypothetical protein [Deltaproteobacteria bacterium]
MKIRDFQIFFFAPFFLLAASGCKGESAEFSLNEEAAATATVTASGGGTIASVSGDTLYIPPGAVSADTVVSLTPLVLPEESDPYLLGGVKFEPDGLFLDAPATLTLMLSAYQPPGAKLKATHAYGGLNEFGDDGYFFTVDSSGMSATGAIYGFSGAGVMKNCHAGSRDYILSVWKKEGRKGQDVKSLAGSIGVSEQDFTGNQFDATWLQKAFGPYFKQCAEFAEGTDFSGDAKNLISQTLS